MNLGLTIRRLRTGVALLLASTGLLPGSPPALEVTDGREFLRLSTEDYLDRIRGMWLAQIVAVQMGLQFEHKPAAIHPVRGYPEPKLRELRENGGSTVDDDWYYEMCALRGFEKYGAQMTVEELGETWLAYEVGTYGSAFFTRQALLAGRRGAEAGSPRHNRMWFTVGNQNRSDLYAMISPGLPNLTASISRQLGHINSYAEGTDGGVLIGGIESISFYEPDIQRAVEMGVRLLHPDSPHRRCAESIIHSYRAGKTWQEAAREVEERWGLEYPGTNSAVWNAGFALVAMYYGAGDFWKSVNIAYGASDFSDADCSAANVATVLAASRGSGVIPPELLEPIRDRIVGDHFGFTQINPPVDLTVTELARRTLRVGLELLQAHGARRDGEVLLIPIQRRIETQPLETFHPDQFTRWWNPAWTLTRSSFGAPGGGVRGVRGGTFLEGDVLATYPRDEVRGVRLSRTLSLAPQAKLSVEVAADPGRVWKLTVFVDHQRALATLVEGGPPLDWPGLASGEYPQPLHEQERCRQQRNWRRVEVDLSAYAGREVTIRLLQDILVRNGFPGNAYWRNLLVQ